MPTSHGAPDDRPSRAYRSTDRYKTAARAVGARVRALRLARGLTLYQASAATDVELRHLQRLETGVLNVTLATLMRIADGFDVDVAELLAEVPRRERGAAEAAGASD